MDFQQITIKDGEVTGSTIQEFVIQLPLEEITVRELIRSRIYQNVKDFNQCRSVVAENPQPFERSEKERTLNGKKSGERHTVEWQQNFDLACKAFERNQFLLFVDGKQLDSLEQTISVTTKSEIKFLSLTLLAGG